MAWGRRGRVGVGVGEWEWKWWEGSAHIKRRMETTGTYHGICVDLDLLDLESGYFGHVVILALTLLFLELEGDTTDGTTLDTLHEVGGVAGNLVAEALGGDDGHLAANLLVGLEVQRQARVILLDEDAGCSLHGFRADAALHGGE